MRKSRSPARVAVVLMFIVLVSSAVVFSSSAQECAWFPTERVDEAFPEQAPFMSIGGGAVGSCAFMGSGMFSLTRMVMGTREKADEYVRNMREGVDESHDVEPAADFGEFAFSYRTRDATDDSGHAAFFIAHRDRVVVMSALNFQEAITSEQVGAARPLIAAALAIAEDEGALEAATNCPWFDSGVLGKLFGGSDYEQHVLGEGSCMAYAGSRVVMVTMMESDDAESLVTGFSHEDCTTHELPDLGTAVLEYECSTGNPRATVRVVNGSRMFQYMLTTGDGTEPTEGDQKSLIDLARLGVPEARP